MMGEGVYMTISLDISGDAERALREQSCAAGVTPEAIAGRIVDRAVQAVIDLHAINGPIGEAFKAYVMTEDELGELLEREKYAMRAERQKKASWCGQIARLSLTAMYWRFVCVS